MAVTFEALAEIAFKLCKSEAELATCAALNRDDIAKQTPETIARLRSVFAECRDQIRKDNQ